jgi:MoxR-like ATPase/RNA binding exosome subunit
MAQNSVQEAVKRVFDLMCTLYPGYYQRQSIEAIFVGLLTNKPILLVGTHASWKSSKIGLIGKLFDKPVSVYRSKVRDVEDVYRLAAALKVDGEEFAKNLLPHSNIQYTQYRDQLYVKATVDSLFYPKVDVEGWAREDKRVPLQVFSKQLYPEIEAEDLLGYAIDHPAVLGLKPPHAVKDGRISCADVIFVDEFFKGPKVTAALHRAMNEREVETTVGVIKLDYLMFAAATNPLTSAYGSNISSLYDIATMDRFAVSSYETPPSLGEIELAKEAWKRFESGNVQRIPVELVYKAREEFRSGEVPEEAIGFFTGLVAALSKCYFTMKEGLHDVPERPLDPFSVEKECSLCLYENAVCSMGSLSKTRPYLAFEDAVKVRAYVYGRKPSIADVHYVLPMILAHRIKFNEAKVTGNMFTNTVSIIKAYAKVASGASSILKKIFEALEKGDFQSLAEIREKSKDRIEIRALIDEFFEQKATTFRVEGKPENEDGLFGSKTFENLAAGIGCFKYTSQDQGAVRSQKQKR